MPLVLSFNVWSCFTNHLSTRDSEVLESCQGEKAPSSPGNPPVKRKQVAHKAAMLQPLVCCNPSCSFHTKCVCMCPGNVSFCWHQTSVATLPWKVLSVSTDSTEVKLQTADVYLVLKSLITQCFQSKCTQTDNFSPREQCITSLQCQVFSLLSEPCEMSMSLV